MQTLKTMFYFSFISHVRAALFFKTCVKNPETTLENNLLQSLISILFHMCERLK